MLKEMIRSILKGDPDDGQVDAESNTPVAKKKKGFFDSLKKSRGGKTDAGSEAILALGEEE